MLPAAHIYQSQPCGLGLFVRLDDLVLSIEHRSQTRSWLAFWLAVEGYLCSHGFARAEVKYIGVEMEGFEADQRVTRMHEGCLLGYEGFWL